MSKPVLRISVIFEVLKPAGVDPKAIAEKISRWDLLRMTEDEMRFYLSVQYWSDSQVKPGREAAEEFLANVERVRENDFLEDSEE